MSQQELIKHGRRLMAARVKPGGWQKKTGGFLLEIFIIIFAITLSLYLERQREKIHERHIQNDFLTGLKRDLAREIEELQGDSLSYLSQQYGFHYFFKTSLSKKVNEDSLGKYWWTLTGVTNLIPNNSRYEGLKAAGLLRVIEDKELLNDIVDLYQEKIPSLLISTHQVSDFKVEVLGRFLLDNTRFDATGRPDLAKIVFLPKFRSYVSVNAFFPEVINRHHMVLMQCRKIIAEIKGE